jgi:putative component of membrane protein insertase Oxa1/YidC/SpoIIIJ protein YidD
MQALLLALIRFYKRFISPHKGYACAYRVYTGHASCSTLGYRAIRRHGAWVGLGLLNKRCRLCGVAQRRYAPVRRPLAAQRGDCDPGCGGDGCDLPGCDWPGPRGLDCCDLLNCCELPERKQRERKRRDKNARVPPRRELRADWPNDTNR